MAELHAAGRQPNRHTAEEIMNLLQCAKNYIPASEVVRREYSHLLLEEYKSYVSEKSRADDRR